jgi:curli biogenesis system outer membrane secretion channel CsgG
MKALSILSILILTACSAPKISGTQMGQISPIKGPSPQRTSTPVKQALECVAHNRKKGQDLRLAVGDIVDGTGARTFTDGNSTLLPQRPDMMFTVAMYETGIKVLNRNATKVAEWEMVQSMEKRLGEGYKTTVEDQEFSYRPVAAGSLLGSTHFVTGALTEVNWNIYSSDQKTNIAGGFRNQREYYISVAVDLMVTNTRTTEITLARSYTKQIVGKEISNGLFRFFDIGEQEAGFGPLELFDVSAGAQSNEPVQNAVRWLMASAAYDIASTLTHTSKKCDDKLFPTVPVLENDSGSVAETLKKPEKKVAETVDEDVVVPVVAVAASADVEQKSHKRGWLSRLLSSSTVTHEKMQPKNVSVTALQDEETDQEVSISLQGDITSDSEEVLTSVTEETKQSPQKTVSVAANSDDTDVQPDRSMETGRDWYAVENRKSQVKPAIVKEDTTVIVMAPAAIEAKEANEVAEPQNEEVIEDLAQVPNELQDPTVISPAPVLSKSGSTLDMIYNGRDWYAVKSLSAVSLSKNEQFASTVNDTYASSR